MRGVFCQDNIMLNLIMYTITIFQKCSMNVRIKSGLEIYIWVETHCTWPLNNCLSLRIRERKNEERAQVG